MTIGIVLEGGGLRGLYSAGILDRLLEAELHVDEMVGVSAGALFGVNFISKQKGRAWRYNQRFLHDKRYMSLTSWLTTGNYVNKEFAFYRVPFELDRFDDDTFQQSTTRFHLPVTHLASGQAEYVTLDSVFAQMEVLRATSALPFVARKVPLAKSAQLSGGDYLDGGIVDSIPVQYAQQLGVDKLIILLTQPSNYRKKAASTWAYSLFYPRYPQLKEAMRLRHQRYNDSLDAIAELERQGQAFVIRPSQSLKVKRFERNLQTLEQLYQLGYRDADTQLDALQHYLHSPL